MRLGWFRPVREKTLVAQQIRALLTARRQRLGKLCDIVRVDGQSGAKTATGQVRQPTGGRANHMAGRSC
jgi:hypothetical protein